MALLSSLPTVLGASTVRSAAVNLVAPDLSFTANATPPTATLWCPEIPTATPTADIDPQPTLWCPEIRWRSDDVAADAREIAKETWWTRIKVADLPPPSCNLCEKPWLFIVSAGGRTGSTTVLNMLNAHPMIRLAGENDGMLDWAAAMLDDAASGGPLEGNQLHANNTASPQQHGPIQPLDLLCDMNSYFDTITTPVDPDFGGKVRGFKDVKWTKQSLDALDYVFPCNRKIFNTRVSAVDQAESQHHAFNPILGGNATVERNVKAIRRVNEYANMLHKRDIAAGQPWRSHMLSLRDDGFTPDQFNGVLAWLGETGCTYSGVIHANDARNGSFNSQNATVEDAKRYLQGNCTMTRLSVAQSP